jgi:hypothetical protein
MLTEVRNLIIVDVPYQGARFGWFWDKVKWPPSGGLGNVMPHFIVVSYCE